jgi:two-component system LytT family response regulator
MRVAIIDDSEIDRLNLATLLADHPDIQVVGEAVTEAAAVSLINTRKPEAVFLDIHLGRENGFSALKKIHHQPLVVITTAHSQYALRGFEVDAVDYLLKPVMEDALARAVQRLKLRAHGNVRLADVRLDPEDVQLLKQADGFQVVMVRQILAITGERIYSRLLMRDGTTFLHDRPLREWKELLPEKMFRSLDRSTIINLSEIRSVASTATSSEYVVSFRQGGQPLAIGETAMRTLRELR